MTVVTNNDAATNWSTFVKINSNSLLLYYISSKSFNLFHYLSFFGIFAYWNAEFLCCDEKRATTSVLQKDFHCWTYCLCLFSCLAVWVWISLWAICASSRRKMVIVFFWRIILTQIGIKNLIIFYCLIIFRPDTVKIS